MGWRQAAPSQPGPFLHWIGAEAGGLASPENQFPEIKTAVFRKVMEEYTSLECQNIWKWRGLGKLD